MVCLLRITSQQGFVHMPAPCSGAHPSLQITPLILPCLSGAKDQWFPSPLMCFPYVSHAPHMRPFTCDAHESPTIPIHISCYGSPANRPAIEYVPPAPIGPAGGAGYRRHGSGGGERGKALRGLAGTPGGVLLTCSFWLYGMPPPCTGHASTTTSQSRRRTYPSRQV